MCNYVDFFFCLLQFEDLIIVTMYHVYEIKIYYYYYNLSKLNFKTVPVLPSLIFPLHLLSSPVHGTEFSFHISPGFLAIFILSSLAIEQQQQTTRRPSSQEVMIQTHVELFELLKFWHWLPCICFLYPAFVFYTLRMFSMPCVCFLYPAYVFMPCIFFSSKIFEHM